MKLKTTCSREISNVDGTIYLYDLYEKDGSFCFKPCLVFEKAITKGIWDNSSYVFNFLADLKNNKKELKQFCKQNKLEYKQTKKDLIAIFKDSLKIVFWKETNLKYNKDDTNSRRFY